MSLGHSPSVVTNGLVMYYDMNNTTKSWLGKPITNLITNGNFSSGAIAPWGAYTVTPTVVTPTVLPYKTFNSNVMQFTSTTGTSGASLSVTGLCTVGQVYTFSFYGRILSGATSTGLTFNNQNGSGDVNAWATSVTLTSSWQKFTFSFTYDVAKTTLYFYHSITGITSQFTEFQLEQSAFATPFVAGTRATTQAVVDLTGNTTLTANSLTYASDNTFSFNGIDNYITVPSTPLALTSWTQPWTLGVWMYVPASATWSDGTNQSHFVSKGTTTGSWGIFLGSTNNTIHAAIRTDAGVYQTGGSITRDAWYNVVGTWDGINTVSTYINGVLADSVTATTLSGVPDTQNLLIGGSTTAFTGSPGIYYTGKLPSVTGYNRALSAAEVKQNFNALRGRYGL